MIKYFPEVTIAEKGHLLFRHAVPWARQMKSLGIFTEQTIETSYSDYNYQYKRLCSKKESENLWRLLKWHFQRNLIQDYNTNSHL